MTAPLRIFLAHPKGVEADALREVEGAMRSTLNALGVAVESITASGAYWQAHFAASGGWDQWCARWSTGVGPDGRFNFDCVVLLERDGIKKGVGRGVEIALRSGRPVYFFEGASFVQVQSLIRTAGNDAWPIFSVGF